MAVFSVEPFILRICAAQPTALENPSISPSSFPWWFAANARIATCLPLLNLAFPFNAIYILFNTGESYGYPTTHFCGKRSENRVGPQ